MPARVGNQFLRELVVAEGGASKASPEGWEVNITVGPFVKPRERKGKRTMLGEERIKPSSTTNRADKTRSHGSEPSD